MTMYDDMRIACRDRKIEITLFPDSPIQMWTTFQNANVFTINNVAEYMLSGERHVWPLSLFPNVAPPFEWMWMEFTMPKHIDIGCAGMPVATLFESVKYDDGWSSMSRMFIQQGKHFARTSWLNYMIVTVNGEIEVLKWLPDDKRFREDTEVDRYFSAIAGPCLMALSFMHCKNVEVTENVPPALPMTKKRRQHPPRTKYYTLNIKPMQRILEEEGHAGTTGLKLALHICRGHFKDFRNGSGLFGKYKGMYWWDSQVRGDTKHGEVVKDYRISPRP